MAPEARNLKASHEQGSPDPGDSVPCLFQLLVAADVPGLVATSLQALPPSSHLLLLSVNAGLHLSVSL